MLYVRIDAGGTTQAVLCVVRAAAGYEIELLDERGSTRAHLAADPERAPLELLEAALAAIREARR